MSLFQVCLFMLELRGRNVQLIPINYTIRLMRIQTRLGVHIFAPSSQNRTVLLNKKTVIITSYNLLSDFKDQCFYYNVVLRVIYLIPSRNISYYEMRQFQFNLLKQAKIKLKGVCSLGCQQQLLVLAKDSKLQKQLI